MHRNASAFLALGIYIEHVVLFCFCLICSTCSFLFDLWESILSLIGCLIIVLLDAYEVYGEMSVNSCSSFCSLILNLFDYLIFCGGRHKLV